MNTSSTKADPAAMRRRARLARVLGALAGAGLAVLAGNLALNRIGGAMVSLSYDLPFVAHQARKADRLRVVYVDKKSGDKLDRGIQAELLDRLTEAGAIAVVYDILFTGEWPDPEVDREFAEAIRRFQKGVDKSGKPVSGANGGPVLLACGRQGIKGTAVIGEQLIPPTDVLLDAANDFGLVAFVPDNNYTVRGLSAGTPDEPSLAWKAALALGAQLDESSRSDHRWINYAGPPSGPDDQDANPAIHSITSSAVLESGEGFFGRKGGPSDPKSEFFRDKIVVVGGKPGIAGSALGDDLFNSPFHRFHPGGDLPKLGGVDLQANVLANLLNGNWLTRSTDRFDLCFIIAFGVLAGVGCALLRPVRATILAVLAVLGLMLAGILFMHFNRVWFPWSVSAFLQIPMALVLGISTNFCVEQWTSKTLAEQQRRLREAFALYLSPQMLDRLAADEFMLKMRGQQAEVAMMMTDLATYTSMCERVRDPVRIVETLQDYFQRVTGPIFDHEGLILQFVGDALFAAWGTPIAEPHPDAKARINAVRAAWELFKKDRMNVEGLEMQTRIGLHFGEVVAGNIGSDQHLAYSLTGDAVNLTSRLEGLNKQFGTSILISRPVYDHPEVREEFRTRRIGKFRVKGRQEVTEVFELIGPVVEEREPEWISLYHQALEALEAGQSDKAREGFMAADAARGSLGADTGSAPGDGASNFFLELLSKGESMPDGVVVLAEK